MTAEYVVHGGEYVVPWKQAKRQFEVDYVSALLEHTHGNVSEAARLARKDRKDFYVVMRRADADPRAFRSPPKKETGDGN